MRVTALIGLIGAGLLLAGCGSGSVSGEAEPAGAAGGEPVFSPCDDIPDDVIQGLGVDPASEEREIMDVKQPGWNICGWRGQDFHLSVFATTHTLDQARANDQYEEFSQIQLNDRRGMTYREKADVDRERCDVAVESGGGVVLVSAGFFGSTKPMNSYEACDVAVQAARALTPYIPE
ncbi:DUF3558 domain-containing protein [Prescottella equi]|uniref:DUF3558 domain-containing protein n=1 Tax=Rhodococcus hoagii TaxID=43767 RepID=UPI000A10964C|nr:DUF3558 domain-containing protein [Prescottella equi]ORL74646.1 hypothetical protein A5N71_19185 [Prescottella equi]